MTARVAIIGGGFSGTLTLVQLVRQATQPLLIDWFDNAPTPALGVAYGTGESYHLLNVRTDKMGAFPDALDDFYHWLHTPEGNLHHQRICPEIAISLHGFMPRMLYGEYLKHLMRQAVLEGAEKQVQVVIHHATVTQVNQDQTDTNTLHIHYSVHGEQKQTRAQAVALATGNLPPRTMPFEANIPVDSIHYLRDVWMKTPHAIFPQQLHTLPADTNVVIIGTGLTTVDTILTLRAHGYAGGITVVSRNGLFPQPHSAEPAPVYKNIPWIVAPESAPANAYWLLKKLRHFIGEAATQSVDWCAIVDALRPITPVLWRTLSLHEKKRFMARLLTFWNVHRHRMAPQIHAVLQQLQSEKTLTVIAGKIQDVQPSAHGLKVSIQPRRSHELREIHTPLLVNCTGPEYDISRCEHPLLRQMYADGLLHRHPLGVGVALAPSGAAASNATEMIFPLGGLLLGELLECTAVPELRAQAQNTAQQLLETVSMENV